MTLITKEDIEYFTNRHSFIHRKSLQIRAQNFSFSSIYVQFFNASLVVLTANKVGFPEPIFSRGLKCVYREMRIDILYLYKNTQLWWPRGITMISTGDGEKETIHLTSQSFLPVLRRSVSWEGGDSEGILVNFLIF